MSAAAVASQPAQMGNGSIMHAESTAASSNGDSVASSSNLPPLQPLLKKSVLRTRALFSSSDPLFLGDTAANASAQSAFSTADGAKARLASKIESEYRDLTQLPSALAAQQGASRPSQAGLNGSAGPAGQNGATAGTKRKLIEGPAVTSSSASAAALDEVVSSKALVRQQHAAQTQPTLLSQSLIKRKEARSIKPDYHPQWKLSKVISGHLGWVRSACVEPGNQWFATGAGDRLIKIWDLATGELKLSLTGHISTVRGLAVSPRHPYLFSAGEDKMVKCWDLEQNKVIRHYHGHLSAVYTLALHPTLDVLVTGGRDSAVRVWDMRTKQAVHIMTGHTGTIADVKCQESDPQVISGSMDTTIRLWDLAAGKTMTQLTHHHKSVRSLAIHPTEYSFASGSAGSSNLKKWKFPEGQFVFNFQGLDNTIVNTVSVNDSGVFFAGADDGAMTWFDYRTGIPFQTTVDKPQPGSLDAEAGIFVSTFDQTGSRLITAGCDKTIKIWAEQ